MPGISICALMDLEDMPGDCINRTWKHKSKVQRRKKEMQKFGNCEEVKLNTWNIRCFPMGIRATGNLQIAKIIYKEPRQKNTVLGNHTEMGNGAACL